MKSKIEIEEVKSDFICPECNIALEFKHKVFSKKQMEEQKIYYKKMVKNWLFRYFKVGPPFRQHEKAMEMRCPKCQKLYHVEK